MEQPKGSDHIISRHPRFEQLVNEKVFAPGLYVATYGFVLVSEIFSPSQVSKRHFWMMLFGAHCPKPTVCWANEKELLVQLDRGSAAFFEACVGFGL